ncbi:MAG: hypothetical protein AAGA11_05855 [Pseudomonadota bacterium]
MTPQTTSLADARDDSDRQGTLTGVPDEDTAEQDGARVSGRRLGAVRSGVGVELVECANCSAALPVPGA